MTSFMTLPTAMYGTTINVGVTDSIHEAVCDMTGCSNEAANFLSEQAMFVCTKHVIQEKEASKTIEYIPCTMPFPDEFEPSYSLEVIAAGDTGLGYVKCLDTYTIVHIPTQDVLILDWFVEREDLAKKWIEELVALADWTGVVPTFHDAGCLKEMIEYACIGMLTEGNLNVGQVSSTVL